MIGKKDEARDVLRKAVAINPKGIASPGPFNQIALAIAATDKPDAAIDWLLNATEIYPNDANPFGTLGDLYDKSGRQDLLLRPTRRPSPSIRRSKKRRQD